MRLRGGRGGGGAGATWSCGLALAAWISAVVRLFRTTLGGKVLSCQALHNQYHELVPCQRWGVTRVQVVQEIAVEEASS